MRAAADQIAAGMLVYDRQGRYLGKVARVYPAPARFQSGTAPFGCFKVRRGALPLLGPPPLLAPFDAVQAVDAAAGRVTVAATREEAAQWRQDRQG